MGGSDSIAYSRYELSLEDIYQERLIKDVNIFKVI
jgi:hypothetical protein